MRSRSAQQTAEKQVQNNHNRLPWKYCMPTTFRANPTEGIGRSTPKRRERIDHLDSQTITAMKRNGIVLWELYFWFPLRKENHDIAFFVFESPT